MGSTSNFNSNPPEEIFSPYSPEEDSADSQHFVHVNRILVILTHFDVTEQEIDALLGECRMVNFTFFA